MAMNIWKNITHDAAAFIPVGFILFSGRLKNTPAPPLKHFTNNGFDHFKGQFAAMKISQRLRCPRHFDADREYPAFVNDSTLIYMKSSTV
jgi:hypothetical protein